VRDDDADAERHQHRGQADAEGQKHRDREVQPPAAMATMSSITRVPTGNEPAAEAKQEHAAPAEGFFMVMVIVEKVDVIGPAANALREQPEAD